jgi:hypothetical protein
VEQEEDADFSGSVAAAAAAVADLAAADLVVVAAVAAVVGAAAVAAPAAAVQAAVTSDPKYDYVLAGRWITIESETEKSWCERIFGLRTRSHMVGNGPHLWEAFDHEPSTCSHCTFFFVPSRRTDPSGL